MLAKQQWAVVWYYDVLPEVGLALVVAVVQPRKVGPLPLPAAVRPRRCIHRPPQCELRLLQAPRLERRLQIHGRACGHAHLGLRPVGVAVARPALSPARGLHAAKVELGVGVLHAMVGRLEVLQDELACRAQVLLGAGVEDAALDKGREVGDAVLGRVSAVRVRVRL